MLLLFSTKWLLLFTKSQQLGSKVSLFFEKYIIFIEEKMILPFLLL